MDLCYLSVFLKEYHVCTGSNQIQFQYVLKFLFVTVFTFLLLNHIRNNIPNSFLSLICQERPKVSRQSRQGSLQYPGSPSGQTAHSVEMDISSTHPH